MSAFLRKSILLALAVTLAHPVNAAHKSKPTGTLKDLEDKEVQVEPDNAKGVSADQAAAEYRRFLELQQASPELRVEAMRRLGDLNLEANERGDAASSTEIAEAIKLYESLLAANPQYPNGDTVLYQLARAYEASNNPAAAMTILGRLIQNYPNSRWIPEAQFRRGEILFSSQRYSNAVDAYARVVSLGPASGFYDQALYKQGWALFKEGRGDDSAEVFLKVLDRLLISPAPLHVFRAPETLPRAERELSDDSLRVLAILLIDENGPETLDSLLTKRGDPPYAHLLYTSLGDLYLEKERYQDAAKAFTAFSKRRADSRYAPSLQVHAIEAYQKGNFASRVIEAKQEFVELYAFGSAFWRMRDRADAPEVAQQLKSNLQDLAQYFHAQAHKNKKAEDYNAGVHWYRALLDSFPDDPTVPQNHYLLAELLFDAGNFAEATQEYERTAYAYPRHEHSADAAYAALVAYQKQEPALEAAARAEWHRKFIDSEVRFATTFPDRPEAAQVLAKSAEDLFALNEFDRTIEVAQQFLGRRGPVDPKQQRVVTTVLAHSLFDRGRYAESEAAYLKVRSLLPANDAGLGDVNDRIAASIYKQAEAKQTAGDANAAVDDYLRVVSLAPTSKISSNAEFDAATALIAQGNWNRAIQVLEQFRKAHPNHELQPEVTRKLAVGYQETGRLADAAAEYDRIASRREETPDVRRAALWQAADLYAQASKSGQAGAGSRATAAYASYVSQFPQPLDAAMDARQHLLEAAESSHDVAAREHWLQEIIRADKAAGASRTVRSKYLAAKANLATAEPTVAAFNSVKLSLPLNKTLKQKRAAMERVLAAYGQALDYGVAEVTTAATYNMAELYRQMGADVLASERPKNLDADSLEQYNVLLEEQAYPFEEKAIALHEANARRTGDGVYDDSVKKSFAALAKLVPARYGKSEVSEDHVASLR